MSIALVSRTGASGDTKSTDHDTKSTEHDIKSTDHDILTTLRDNLTTRRNSDLRRIVCDFLTIAIRVGVHKNSQAIERTHPITSPQIGSSPSVLTMSPKTVREASMISKASH